MYDCPLKLSGNMLQEKTAEPGLLNAAVDSTDPRAVISAEKAVLDSLICRVMYGNGVRIGISPRMCWMDNMELPCRVLKEARKRSEVEAGQTVFRKYLYGGVHRIHPNGVRPLSGLELS